MKLTGIGVDEPDEDAPLPDIAIRITVPEEFMGCSIGELMNRDGVITGMEPQSAQIVSIKASLSGSEFDGFQKFVVTVTLGRGNVERDVSS